MANLPNFVDFDWASDIDGTQEKSKELIDFAVETFNQQKTLRDKITKAQNGYNRLLSKADYEKITRRYAKNSKTPYKRYGIGRSKINRLIGEFLRIGLQSSVYTYNREATDRKRGEANLNRGRAMSAPIINELRDQGIDPYDGAQMPDINNPELFDETLMKTMSERVMQKIINSKIKSENMKETAKQILLYFILNSTAYGKHERDLFGKDVFRIINPKNRIEPLFDSNIPSEFKPFLGEARLMTEAELLSEEGLSSTDVKKIKEYFSGSLGTTEEVPGDTSLNPVLLKTSNGANAALVYFVEWKGYETTQYKEENGFVRENKSKYKKSNATYFKITNAVKYKGIKLGDSVHVGIRRAINNAVTENSQGKYIPLYDYQSYTIGALNNYTNSLYEIIMDIEDDYDYVRWIIKREIRKIHGKGVIFDRAFQDKSFTSTMYDLIEEGVITANSSADENLSQKEGNVKDMLEAFDLGGSDIINQLVSVAMDYERVIADATGINDARQGIEKATMTATANQNNLESSRSATYELFDAVDNFMAQIFTTLCNKVKLNDDYIENVAKGTILSDEEVTFLEQTDDMMFDSFGTYVYNTKKEMAIRQAVEMFIPQEINASKLSVTDFAEYAMKDTLNEALEVLKKGRERTEKLEQQMQQNQIDQQDRKVQADLQRATDDREDRQVNEKENIVLEKNLELRNNAAIEQIKGDQAIALQDKKGKDDLAQERLKGIYGMKSANKQKAKSK